MTAIQLNTESSAHRHSKGFSMDDLRARLDAQDNVIKGIRGDMTIQATAAQGMQKELATVSSHLTTIIHLLGEEKEDGQGNYLGTGLLGRMRRVERAQRSLRELYHRWIAFGAGFSACLTASTGLIYWMVTTHFSFVSKAIH